MYPAGFSSSSAKGCTRGTHRVVTPSETLARIAPAIPLAGITRVSVITGLDHIGLPVVTVCRPNARSLAVSQGKGLDLDAARASGLMEAIESWHAEHVSVPLLYASWVEMQANRPVVDVTRLPRLSAGAFHPHKPLLWAEGRNLLSGEPAWVPYEMVHTNFTLPLPPGSGCFLMSSNGLASGNHPDEAAIHGICEVIERDANALWFAADAETRRATRINADTIDDEDCRAVLRLFEAADVAAGIWETTTDIGLASFRCVAVDRQPNFFRQLYAVDGSGCHPARGIALLRALTEAAQCRLTYISGTRDDGGPEFFERVRNPDAVARARREIEQSRGARPFTAVPTRAASSCAEDVALACHRLAAVAIDEVIVVDLAKPDVAIPVVRVIVPGLEGLHDAPGYIPGARARAAASRQAGTPAPLGSAQIRPATNSRAAMPAPLAGARTPAAASTHDGTPASLTGARAPAGASKYDGTLAPLAGARTPAAATTHDGTPASLTDARAPAGASKYDGTPAPLAGARTPAAARTHDGTPASLTGARAPAGASKYDGTLAPLAGAQIRPAANPHAATLAPLANARTPAAANTHNGTPAPLTDVQIRLAASAQAGRPAPPARSTP